MIYSFVLVLASLAPILVTVTTGNHSGTPIFSEMRIFRPT